MLSGSRASAPFLSSAATVMPATTSVELERKEEETLIFASAGEPIATFADWASPLAASAMNTLDRTAASTLVL